MTETFQRLSEGRQQLLLDICIDEFAENPYQIASTNSIVRRAGISKGLFFKYFGSKQSVYLHVVQTVLTELGELQAEPFSSADIVERSEELFSRHMDYARRRPPRYRLALRSAVETEPTIRLAVESIRAEIAARLAPALYDGVDWSIYNLPKAEVIEFLRCLDLGLRQAAAESLTDPSDMIRFAAHVRESHQLARNVLRHGLYVAQFKEDEHVD